MLEAADANPDTEGDPLAYFDHNATTPVDPRVRDTMLPWLAGVHGNPSSAHAAGRRARHAVEAARALEPAPGVSAVVSRIDAGSDRDAILAAMDTVRARHDDCAAILVSVDEPEGKVVIVAKVPEPLIAKGLKAGDWVRVAAQACGGKGGGRPDSAQGGGTEPAKADDALASALEFAREKLA